MWKTTFILVSFLHFHGLAQACDPQKEESEADAVASQTATLLQVKEAGDQHGASLGEEQDSDIEVELHSGGKSPDEVQTWGVSLNPSTWIGSGKNALEHALRQDGESLSLVEYEADSHIAEIKGTLTDLKNFLKKRPGAASKPIVQDLGFALQPEETTDEHEEADEEQLDLSLAEFERNITRDLLTSRTANPQKGVKAWGIDRVDQKGKILDGEFEFSYGAHAGEGVHVYVMDTGILASHQEFNNQGQRNAFASFENLGAGPKVCADLDDPDCANDCQGHGTHVAATVVGKSSGIAKGATVHGVKVIGCSGSGSVLNLISGINWATNHVKTGGHRGVIVMSLTLKYDEKFKEALGMVQDALEAAKANGIPSVISSGNFGKDACEYFPAMWEPGITVGALDYLSNKKKPEQMWKRSNYGKCVDILAPGVDIQSASYTKYNQFNKKTGTSMAAPHVAGAVALLEEEFPLKTPDQIRDTLIARATSGKLSWSSLKGTPNKLLYVGGRQVTPPPTPPPTAAAWTGKNGETCRGKGWACGGNLGGDCCEDLVCDPTKEKKKEKNGEMVRIGEGMCAEP